MNTETIKGIKHFNTHQRAGQLVCACSDWFESDGEGLHGSCEHTRALDVILNPDDHKFLLYRPNKQLKA